MLSNTNKFQKRSKVMLKDKTVVIGISGGIAAYKACDVVSKLKN
ncbi:coenzyme A biosynthesis bifunctional CoaBC, phosphopantothenoylcysteine synthetase/decarboxylase [Clostridioides difficile DA00165]|nr:coenzyme A biosynthesis bifunctional CoaBC, phosphopantothenoylcysteine synthetase/decarboxylase [Clostridioides difficile DA00165]